MNRPIAAWSGRRVWIVGASSGIGAALAAALLAAGARVALSARNRAGLEAVAQSRGNATVLPMDATDPQAWAAAHAQLQADWNGLDLVVFCAAAYEPQRAWETRAPQVRQTLEANVGHVYYGLETVLPLLRAQGHGGIAILASVAGYMGLPGAAVYGPTKAALINLTELLYSELHPQGIDVYLVNPGFVKTRLTDRNRFAMPALQTPEQAAVAIMQGLEQGRFEIHFPRRFTALMHLLRHLPYRLRFALIRRAVQ